MVGLLGLGLRFRPLLFSSGDLLTGHCRSTNGRTNRRRSHSQRKGRGVRILRRGTSHCVHAKAGRRYSRPFERNSKRHGGTRDSRRTTSGRKAILDRKSKSRKAYGGSNPAYLTSGNEGGSGKGHGRSVRRYQRGERKAGLSCLRRNGERPRRQRGKRTKVYRVTPGCF